MLRFSTVILYIKSSHLFSKMW